jgi:hypothetical protein
MTSLQFHSSHLDPLTGDRNRETDGMGFDERIRLRKEREREQRKLARTLLIAGLCTFVFAGSALFLRGASPQQRLVNEVTEYIATHSKTEAAVDHVGELLKGSRCQILGFHAKSVTGNEVYAALGDTTEGFVSAARRVTYGDKGRWYVATMEVDCD